MNTTFAYIDPATTSYIIQIVAGVIIACGAAVGIFWRKIMIWFQEKRINSIEKKLRRQEKKKHE